MRTKRLSTRALLSIVALFFSALVVAAVVERTSDANAGSCSEGLVSRLYLGQATPDGTVTDAQWRSFVAESVTPRFPTGFTELQADGHWRGDNGVVIEEHTRIVEFAHAGMPETREQVRAIASEYRRRFAQESVLMTQFRTVYCFES